MVIYSLLQDCVCDENEIYGTVGDRECNNEIRIQVSLFEHGILDSCLFDGELLSLSLTSIVEIALCGIHLLWMVKYLTTTENKEMENIKQCLS